MILEKLGKLLEKTSRLLFGGHFESQYNEDVVAKILGDEPEEQSDIATPVDSSEEMSEKKREIFSLCLESGVTSVVLDATVSGVVVPDRFKGARDLVLNYSYRYDLPDFSFDEKLIVGSLSFSGAPFKCIVPWNAVLGIGSQTEGKFYAFEQAPTSQSSPKMQQPPQQSSSSESPESRRKKFQVVKGGKS